MIATLVRRFGGNKVISETFILRKVLEELDITAFTPDSVAEYKQERLYEVTLALRPAEGKEIKERECGGWEHGELNRLLQDFGMRDGCREEPMIRFWKTPQFERFYTCLQWVKTPLESATNVPEFVKAKAGEIATQLPEATFTVEELRSERCAYDPFLIVAYGDESYYVEAWDESDFERKCT